MGESKYCIISRIYHDPAGYGSMNATLKEAKVFDKTIKLKDIKKWFEKCRENNKLKGTE